MNRALEFEGIRKTFPGVVALDDVSFGVGAGSVHALLGENGAGKSTLLKILSGAHRADEGRVLLDGKEKRFRNTQDAIAEGIAVIYQELQLVDDLSVAENLFLGHLPQRFGKVDRHRLFAESGRLLEWVGEALNPRTRLGALPIAQRQMVEIAKALSLDARVLAFDEPTSSLTSREVDRLFEVIRQLRDEGRVILYVSHRMEEIFKLCDAATVFRDGKHVQTWDSLQEVTRDELVRSMVGRDVAAFAEEGEARALGDVALRVADVTGPGVVAPADLAIRKGEIVGLFGLVGAGRTELLKLIYGAAKARSGRVSLHGVELGPHGPGKALATGLAWCPEDRKAEGIVPLASVQDNLNLGVRRRFSPLGFVIHPGREHRNALKGVERLGIRASGLRQAVGNLSGGNQQKTILGRVLGHDVEVLLLDEPTRGIDIGAKQEIYAIIRDLARNGAAVLFVSSDLPEVINLSDRVLVMREGALVGELPRGDATPERVLELALPAGGRAAS
ncbi:MAG: L-arabinose ABC transporter ATP-binding protein AraG [Fimbriimonadaceae bacterium]|nr:L-arabinose ABC transporter ATP-binding protein AraG [Chthonomonadaceae bacterium]MCO5296258.1 L-arabinose ABC transporter ATP-binding protein AraG [Fimbriimonadaceae bacterium]